MKGETGGGISKMAEQRVGSPTPLKLLFAELGAVPAMGNYRRRLCTGFPTARRAGHTDHEPCTSHERKCEEAFVR